MSGAWRVLLLLLDIKTASDVDGRRCAWSAVIASNNTCGNSSQGAHAAVAAAGAVIVRARASSATGGGDA